MQPIQQSHDHYDTGGHGNHTEPSEHGKRAAPDNHDCDGKDSVALRLSCASTLSNIYLGEEWDPFILQQLPLRLFCRYIDDSAAIIKIILHAVILRALNVWHHTIAVKDKDLNTGRRVNFLDLDIKVNGERRIELSTFRKSQHL